MQGKYILLVLLVLLSSVMPSAALTSKIVAGSPVFIGESNVDLTRALDNCRIIGWVPEGSERTMPAAKNITLRPLNEFSATLAQYTFSPADYRGYEGEWYCEERAPYKTVFVIHEPSLKISAWDLDADKDVTGTTVPTTANITYRVDTNMDVALQHKYRLDLTPADGFYTVKLTDPNGKPVTNIYTGSYGKPGAVIQTFDTSPYITSSPYVWNFWKFGGIWDRQARNIQGDLVYPTGTYRLTASQNLNRMADTYKVAGISDTEGILTSSAEITFVQPNIAVPVTTLPAAEETTIPAPTLTTDIPPTLPATAEPVQEETTKAVYQPLPAWIALVALGFAAILLGSRHT